MSIFVTKPFMPPIDEYHDLIAKIWEKKILTNQGPYVVELENKLRSFLGVKHFHYVTNGTLALQLALRALGIDSGEVITTPFSYAATASSILWEHCKPIFVDIEADNFTLDANKIERAITPETRAIMPVHVFGYACNIKQIQEIADKYQLKVIYDGAHAFASGYGGKSLLAYGDITTSSFHATKLFHTIEGGACITKDKKISNRLDLMRRFGCDKEQYFCLGINAKQSEFNAAMGLANLPYIYDIIAERKRVCEVYDKLLEGKIIRPKAQKGLEYNYAYYPIAFKAEEELLKVFGALNENGIFPRRYFFPSLNTLPYFKSRCHCPVSENICSRIACLPLYSSLSSDEAEKIALIISRKLTI